MAIKFSKILEEDKHYFKNRIRMEFVSKYYDFMQSCYNDDYFSPIPDREFGSTNLILTPFHKSKFGQHYDFFIKELP